MPSGFGRAIGTYPTVFINGQVRDIAGIWRSTDEGETWQLLSPYPAGYYTTIQVVTGDMNRAGRVYVGLIGNSFIYGDP